MLSAAIEDAAGQGKNGLVTVAGKKKFHFMSDGKWLLGQGFTVCGETPDGFALLVYKINEDAPDPVFGDSVQGGGCPDKEGLVAYYSNRCPYTELHVTQSLREAAGKRGMPLKVIKLETSEQARQAPTPATVFSLFYNGRFVTTDVGACMDGRLDKALGLK